MAEPTNLFKLFFWLTHFLTEKTLIYWSNLKNAEREEGETESKPFQAHQRKKKVQACEQVDPPKLNPVLENDELDMSSSRK